MAANETPTTELEAVNQLLRAIQEAPISSLTGDGGVEVATAKATLRTVSRTVQMAGWQFNTEFNFPLTRAVDGTITAPLNALSVDLKAQGGVDPILRGYRVYDRLNHTYTFAADVKATVILMLPFDELPETARAYVAHRATRIYQDENAGDTALHNYKIADEQVIYSAFLNEQAEDEDLRFGRARSAVVRGI